MEKCIFGEQKFIDRGYYFICSKTGNHCGEYHRWCILVVAYVPKLDCSKCPVYLEIAQEQETKNSTITNEEVVEEQPKVKNVTKKVSKKIEVEEV